VLLIYDKRKIFRRNINEQNIFITGDLLKKFKLRPVGRGESNTYARAPRASSPFPIINLLQSKKNLPPFEDGDKIGQKAECLFCTGYGLFHFELSI